MIGKVRRLRSSATASFYVKRAYYYEFDNFDRVSYNVWSDEWWEPIRRQSYVDNSNFLFYCDKPTTLYPSLHLLKASINSGHHQKSADSVKLGEPWRNNLTFLNSAIKLIRKGQHKSKKDVIYFSSSRSAGHKTARPISKKGRFN